MSTLTNKDEAILEYCSEWVNANLDNWESCLEAVNNGGFMFDRVVDGDEICDHFKRFLIWLIESKQAIDSSFSGERVVLSDILNDIKNKKQIFLTNFPDITSLDNSANVDYTKQQVYPIYKEFFEFVRQIDVISNMSDDSIENYRYSCRKISKKVIDLRNKINFNLINETLRSVNGKLNWQERNDLDGVNNINDQLCGWMQERLFNFNKSIIPYQYLSVDDFYKDIDFQYNFVETKAKALTRKYKKEAKPLVDIVSDLWNKFKDFYREVNNLDLQKVYSVSNVDYPIRPLFLLGKVPEMIGSIQSVFKSVPSSIYKKNSKMNESHFHIAMHSMFKALGLCPFSEQATCNGRSDMLVNAIEDDKKVLYIIEYKITNNEKDKSENALRQIKKNDYGLAYKDDYHKIYGLGLCFSTVERNIIGNEFKPVLLYEGGVRQFKVPKKNK